MSDTKTAIVLGSTASTIFTARLLETRGYNVQIFDPGNHFQKDNPKFIHPDLESIPATEDLLSRLQSLANAAGISLQAGVNDLSPLVWDDNQFKSFIGFGENKSKSISAISKHNLNARWSIAPTLSQLSYEILNSFTGPIHSYAELSKVDFGIDGIQGIEINGAKKYAADVYVFSQDPRALQLILNSEVLSAKDWVKVSRSPIWSKIAIEWSLPPIELAQNQITFYVPTSADNEPWVGLPCGAPSRWVCYIPEEKADDPEAISNEIRGLKKWIAKSNPHAAEAKSDPKIHVIANVCGSFSWLNYGASFERELKNTLFVSELLSDYDGLCASADTSCRAIQRLLERDTQTEVKTKDEPRILTSL